MPVPDDDLALLSSELRGVIGQLVRRLRAQYRFPVAQATVLGRLSREGPMSVSDLAAAERVRPQSMAQTVGDLEAAGMVTRRPDPDDGRRALVELTSHGRTTLEAERLDREGWLAQTLARDFTPAERDVVRDSVALLQRIADAE